MTVAAWRLVFESCQVIDRRSVVETPLNQTAPKAQPNYLKWILIGCGALFVVTVGLSLIGTIIYFMARSPVRGSRGPLFGSSSVKLVDDHGIQTAEKTWSSCTAFAPADWTITGNEQRVGIGVDLAARDQSMFSSYGIVAVPRTTTTLGTDYYGTATPEKFLQTILEGGGASEFALENESRSVDGYTLRYWRANSHGKPFRGFVLYQTFETGDPSTYIVAYHLGSTEAGKWEENRNLVYDVAVSIRCTKHLFPAQESSASRPRGSSKDQIEDELS